MNEYEKTPLEVYKILNQTIFKYKQPSVRAKSVLKNLNKKQANILLEYLINYTNPDLISLVEIIIEGISKSDTISLIKLEPKLNEALTCISNVDVDKLRSERMERLKEIALIDNLIKEKDYKNINND